MFHSSLLDVSMRKVVVVVLTFRPHSRNDAAGKRKQKVHYFIKKQEEFGNVFSLAKHTGQSQHRVRGIFTPSSSYVIGKRIKCLMKVCFETKL